MRLRQRAREATSSQKALAAANPASCMRSVRVKDRPKESFTMAWTPLCEPRDRVALDHCCRTKLTAKDKNPTLNHCSIEGYGGPKDRCMGQSECCKELVSSAVLGDRVRVVAQSRRPAKISQSLAHPLPRGPSCESHVGESFSEDAKVVMDSARGRHHGKITSMFLRKIQSGSSCGIG